MQVKRSQRLMRWSLSNKLAIVLLLTVALPSMLFMIPYSVSRRQATIEDVHRQWLEGHGSVIVAQLEQTLQELTFRLERQIYNLQDFPQLVDYLTTTGVTATPRFEKVAFIEQKLHAIMDPSASISRVRFFDADLNMLVDATKQTGETNINHAPFGENSTPADSMIANNRIGPWSTVTTIYQDANDTPSIDVIFTLHATWDQNSTDPMLGIAVITQDLRQAATDATLPDIYGVLQLQNQPYTATELFLLSDAGILLSPASDRISFTNAQESEGFQLAQRGDSNVSFYDSPLSDEKVMGYHTMLTANHMPSFVLLVETPTADLNAQVIKESMSSLIGIAGGFLALTLLALYFARRIVIRPIQRITNVAREVAGGGMSPDLNNDTADDEFGELSLSINNMSSRLLNTIDDLEMRVTERTQSLETMLEIGRVLTGIHDRDTLLKQVVTLLRNHFKHIYHAQVFLVDPVTRRANLRASTGDVGKTLLERGHYLEVGSQSVIGSVTSTGNAVVALDTSNNPIHRRNEFLPDTRAEMALPLRAGNQVIGALDVQSTNPNAFSEQDIDLFQGMADQIAIALENAALFDESNQRLREIERLNRMLTNAAWNEAAQNYATSILSANTDGQPESSQWSPLQQQAIRTRQIAERIEGEHVMVAVPVQLRDQVLGAVEWQVPLARYTANTRQTAEELSARLALAIDNIRLFEQSQQVARREQIVNQISSKLIGQTDIDQILQTAVRELGLALRAPHTAIRLASSQPHPVDD